MHRSDCNSIHDSDAVSEWASQRFITCLRSIATLRPAHADGGKDDKKFQACLSQCVYEATKITKGIAQVEVMSRAEAFATCKPKCATSKDQLLIGQPKKQ